MQTPTVDHEENTCHEVNILKHKTIPSWEELTCKVPNGRTSDPTDYSSDLTQYKIDVEKQVNTLTE